MTPLERWLQLLTAERDRRQGIDGDALGRLLDQLAEMGKRLRADPNFEPAPEENRRAVDRWFKERFG
jgi:hypothetical protein